MVHFIGKCSQSNRAIVFTSPFLEQGEKQRLKLPNLLLPIQGKPMLERVIEQLTAYNCQQITVILGNDATLIKQFLGDGSRWNCEFEYFYVDANESLGHCMRRIGVHSQLSYWLVDANQLPVESITPRDSDSKAGEIICWRQGTESHWGLWGLFAGYWLLMQPHPDVLHEQILEDPLLRRHWQAPCLSASNLTRVLSSSKLLLDQQAETIQIGQHCSIHSDAKLIAPVYIGDHVKISANCIIGPYATIESNCQINQGCEISHSLVIGQSCIGQNFNMQHSIAHGALLSETIHNEIHEQTENFLLAPIIQEQTTRSLRRNLTLISLQSVLYPLYLWCKLSLSNHKQTTQHSTTAYPSKALLEPAQTEVDLSIYDVVHQNQAIFWQQHFCYCFYPSLKAIRQGKLALTGPLLRPWSEINTLHPLWRQLYGEYRCGVLNESLFQDGPPGQTHLNTHENTTLALKESLRADFCIFLGTLNLLPSC